MGFTFVSRLLPIEDLVREYPLSPLVQEIINQNRLEVKSILENQDDRLLIIIGPCSAWPKEAVLEYAQRLAALSETVKSHLKIIMRVYIQKPRTTKGWTGPINHPDIFSEPNIESGIKYTRDMMIKIVSMGLPIASEVLFTHNLKGFVELLSWAAIGARSSEDQEHRIFASALDCAVGLKNPTHGSLVVSINSVLAAQAGYPAVFNEQIIMTHGNPHAHLVLRGSNQKPNYSIYYLKQVEDLMKKVAIKNPAVLIDVSHDNCLVKGKKEYTRQPGIVFDILKTIQKRSELKRLVKGFMLESFIEDGCQKVDLDCPNSINLKGLSITDPCISWEQSEAFIVELAKYRLKK